MKTIPAKEVLEKDDMIIVTVKLASGRFEGRIEMPLFSPKADQIKFVESWLAMMEHGLSMRKE